MVRFVQLQDGVMCSKHALVHTEGQRVLLYVVAKWVGVCMSR